MWPSCPVNPRLVYLPQLSAGIPQGPPSPSPPSSTPQASSAALLPGKYKRYFCITRRSRNMQTPSPYLQDIFLRVAPHSFVFRFLGQRCVYVCAPRIRVVSSLARLTTAWVSPWPTTSPSTCCVSFSRPVCSTHLASCIQLVFFRLLKEFSQLPATIFRVPWIF